MALLTSKTYNLGSVVFRRSFHLGSVSSGKKVMPDPLEHATGLERQELMAEAAGNENPFDMRVYKRTSGDLTNPTVIPSFYQSRLIGCICQEESTCVNWMWLTKGEPKRCECGYFFKLTDAKPLA